MGTYGLSETDVRSLLERELGRSEASTSFYWESEEVEEVMDLIVDAVSKAIAENNRRLEKDLKRALADAEADIR